MGDLTPFDEVRVGHVGARDLEYSSDIGDSATFARLTRVNRVWKNGRSSTSRAWNVGFAPRTLVHALNSRAGDRRWIGAMNVNVFTKARYRCYFDNFRDSSKIKKDTGFS